MEYLHWVANASTDELAATLNAEVQLLVMRYGVAEAVLDWRFDSDESVHCNWHTNEGRSPCVRFDNDLNVRTFCDDPKQYNLIDQGQFEQLIYDVVDTLVPNWG